jgi:RHS repeat-associated protein
VLTEVAGSKLNPIAYSVYGKQSGRQEINGRLGFNGELRETRLGWYLLGNGYRAYSPVLMRFHSPDSWSPFGKGGLNAYMYCVGDPVNFSDPTGHIKFAGLFSGSSRRMMRTPSTSSLTPLISSPDEAARTLTTPLNELPNGVTNPTFTNYESSPTPRYENIPIITGMTPREPVPFKPIAPRRGDAVPPPPPLKQKARFNDTGGQVGIISPNWLPHEPRRYREIWKSEPFRFPYAPAPRMRTLKNGAIGDYCVTYDRQGNPTQHRVQKVYWSQLQNRIIRE